MHSNETICKKNPVEQSSVHCQPSLLEIDPKKKNKSFLCISLHLRPHGAMFAKSENIVVIPKM